MREFLEKARSLNNWNWQGSPWQYLLYAGILLVLLFSKKKTVRMILGWLPLVYLFCIYNPLFMAVMEIMGVGGNQYFARMFSFMPLMYAIAAGIVFLIGRIPKSWLKFIVVVAVSAGLILSGRSIYDQDWYVRAQNFAKVPKDTYEVAEILENTGDKDVSVATFDPITNYMRQVSDVVTAYARFPGDIWYMLNADPPDVQAVMKAAGEQGMDYITARRTEMTLQAFRDAGYEPLALTDNMAVYKVTGVRKAVRTFNAKRQPISETVYDGDGKIEKNTLGFSTIAYEYDDRGYQSSIDYLDAEGRPMMISWGYAGERREYSPRGLVLSFKYVDTEGKAVRIWSWYEIRNEYDLKGRLTRESYYDANGNSMIRTDDNYASRAIEYNGEGLNTKERFYDIRGEMVLCSNGYAEVRRSYDQGGNQISEAYYDAEGKPVLSPEGYATLIRQYDEVGNIVLERYEDGMGHPILRDIGYAEVRRTYDDNNQVLMESFYDAEGHLVNNDFGYATLERIYDDLSLKEEIRKDMEGNILYQVED